MLLPQMIIAISIDIFETNIEYFLNEYDLSDYNLNLLFEKIGAGSSGYRYCIYITQEETEESNPEKIGEIDVLKVFEGKVEIKAAVYNLERTKIGIHFFDDFYNMVWNKWHPLALQDFDGFVATTTYVKIGIETGYDGIEGVLSTIPAPKDSWKVTSESKLPVMKIDISQSMNNSEKKEIIQKYKNEVKKGLPDISYKSTARINKINTGVHEKTIARADRIKKIKDLHPHWSQPQVTREYNKNKYVDDPFISTTDLQNAYKAMGWKWERADR